MEETTDQEIAEAVAQDSDLWDRWREDDEDGNESICDLCETFKPDQKMLLRLNNSEFAKLQERAELLGMHHRQLAEVVLRQFVLGKVKVEI